MYDAAICSVPRDASDRVASPRVIRWPSQAEHGGDRQGPCGPVRHCRGPGAALSRCDGGARRVQGQASDPLRLRSVRRPILRNARPHPSRGLDLPLVLRRTDHSPEGDACFIGKPIARVDEVGVQRTSYSDSPCVFQTSDSRAHFREPCSASLAVKTTRELCRTPPRAPTRNTTIVPKRDGDAIPDEFLLLVVIVGSGSSDDSVWRAIPPRCWPSEVTGW